MPENEKLTAIIKMDVNRANNTLTKMDMLWNKCKNEGWFDQCPGLMNYLMWIEHEVSRNCAMTGK